MSVKPITPSHSMYLQNLPRCSDWPDLSDRDEAFRIATGISQQAFEFFRDMFAGHPFDYSYEGEDGWRTASKGRLGNRDLLRHLAGKISIATSRRWSAERKISPARWFAFDLDSSEDSTALLARYDRLTGALGLPALVLRTPNGGLHAYWFLSEEVPAEELFDPQSGDGVLPRILAEHQLELRAGELELKPTSRYWDARGQLRPGLPLRLPFGRRTALLDPIELAPLVGSSQIAGLNLVLQQFADETIDLIDVQDLRSRAVTAGRAKRPKSRKPTGRRVTTQRDQVLAEEYFANGLTGSGQLNEALFAIAVSFALQGMEREDARQSLHEWLDGNHNGQSLTYNQNPRNAHRKADENLDWVFDNWSPRTRMGQWAAVSERDMARVLALTDGDLVDPLTGEVINDRAKAQRVAFEVIRGMKQWVTYKAVEAAQIVAHRHPDLILGSHEFDEQFKRAARYFWPHPPHPLFVVQNPLAFRKSIRGVGERSLGPIWRALKATMLFRPRWPASAQKHRAESFLVELDFGACPLCHSPAYTSFPSAVVRMLPPGEITEQYTEHAAKRIRSEAHARCAVSGDIALRSPELYVARLLGFGISPDKESRTEPELRDIAHFRGLADAQVAGALASLVRGCSATWQPRVMQ